MENLKAHKPRFRYHMLAVLFIASFTACEDEDVSTTNEVTAQDSSFVINATYSNLAEIEMGELAVSRASHDSLRTFGERMVAKHTTAQQQLAAIATDRGIAIPDTLNNAHFVLYQQLSALGGAAFDSAYISSQVTAHQQAQQMYEAQIEQGQNTQLIDYASSILSTIIIHLERATELRDDMTAQ